MSAQDRPVFHANGLIFKKPRPSWVDSVMTGLTLEQKIAQLMVVRVPLNLTDAKAAEFSAKMNELGVGGVCFFAGTAKRQVELTKLFQHEAKVPLLVCLDAEWGLGMRLTDCFSFPRNAIFGSLQNGANDLVYRMGEEIGRQCKMIGVHINFAPVVDINSNPKNPVIGTRSFGTDREQVARLGESYIQGMQSQGVMAVAKHFPGHGDTDKDSHLQLPVINHSLPYIDSIDLYPFRKAISANAGGIMIAHLQVNELDKSRPSSLSQVIVEDLLRNKMNFNGLIITDGLDMKGITNDYKDGQGELLALEAGNDILLLPPDVEKSISVIAQAAGNSKVLRNKIDYHCRRVLQAKYELIVDKQLDLNDLIAPDITDLQRCNDIIADLNINLDRRIDSLINLGIASKAYPGCQIVVMHKGRLVMSRSYGQLSYDADADSVTNQTVYDLASLTKITATTLAMMKLVDGGRVKLDDPLSRYLPYLKNTDKEKITIREAMSHIARLKAFDSYWQRTSNRDSIFQLIAESKLNSARKYLYSDLGFILLSDLVEKVTGMPLDMYVERHFYIPMGLQSTHFNPISKGVDIERIAPTEIDTLRGVIRGYVHDPNAYALGGVSGHAGLFSTAEEVALIMQMLLNGGELDGHRYISSAIVDTFTSRHYVNLDNRRALGFDKVTFKPSTASTPAPEASQESFGHTGFTGTMAWADPKNELVFVFLSNRVHPIATPNKLAKMNIRTDLHSFLYQDINKK
ncbi:MAG: serine hydrolase [Bacteroidales bacterium]|nr:serine hydrolase [Bacteroidales bacterium]